MNPRDWFEQLQPRERLLVLGASAVLSLLLVYLLLWEPVARQVNDLRQAVKAQRGQLQWMREASSEARALQAQPHVNLPGGAGGSLIGSVESTLSRAGLRGNVRHIEPSGNDKISLDLRGVPFNALIGWLNEIQMASGAAVEDFTASRSDAEGLVDARLSLKRGS